MILKWIMNEKIVFRHNTSGCCILSLVSNSLFWFQFDYVATETSANRAQSSECSDSAQHKSWKLDQINKTWMLRRILHHFICRLLLWLFAFKWLTVAASVCMALPPLLSTGFVSFPSQGNSSECSVKFSILDVCEQRSQVCVSNTPEFAAKSITTD